MKHSERWVLMFLKQSKYKNGKVFLSIVEGYYDPVSKKPKQRTVEKIGYLDDLKDQYEDPVAYFKQRAQQLTQEKKESVTNVKLEINTLEKLKVGSDERKNLGYAVLSQIYHRLHLDQFINNKARHKKFQFNCNTLLKNAVYNRILFPGSKRSDFSHRHLFFENTDYSLEDIYRHLNFLSSLVDDCQKFLNQQVTENFGRDTSLVYYDVTNYYFEIDEPTDLLKKGVSKEKRKNPIVQMGLLMDKDGIPISYHLYPGNTNDCLTYRPFIKQAKMDFDLGRIIVVADKAMNTGDNIWYTLSANNGYVFSQSIRGASQKLKEYVLDEEGYRWLGKEKNFKIKSRLEPREINVTMTSGKKKKKWIDEKQVVFYSEKYASRARYERQKAIDKAQKIIANPGMYSKSTAVGACGYIKNIQFDKETGEIKSLRSQLSIDTKKIEEEAALDGYYMLMTSEYQETDENILEMYRGLWRIEESFKITKSDLEARPVFVRREDRIQAHFLICFISLLIMRLIQKELNYRYSVGRIIENLRRCEGIRFEKNLYIFTYFSEELASISNHFDIPLDKKYLTQKEIKKILSETK